MQKGLVPKLIIDVRFCDSNGELEVTESIEVDIPHSKYQTTLLGVPFELDDGYFYAIGDQGRVQLGTAIREVPTERGLLWISIRPYHRTGIAIIALDPLPDKHCGECAVWDRAAAVKLLDKVLYHYDLGVMKRPLTDFAELMHIEVKRDGGKGFREERLGYCAKHDLLCEDCDSAPRACFLTRDHG